MRGLLGLSFFSLLLMSITWTADGVWTAGITALREVHQGSFFPFAVVGCRMANLDERRVSRLDDLRMVRFRFYTLWLLGWVSVCFFLTTR